MSSRTCLPHFSFPSSNQHGPKRSLPCKNKCLERADPLCSHALFAGGSRRSTSKANKIQARNSADILQLSKVHLEHVPESWCSNPLCHSKKRPRCGKHRANKNCLRRPRLARERWSKAPWSNAFSSPAMTMERLAMREGATRTWSPSSALPVRERQLEPVRSSLPTEGAYSQGTYTCMNPI